MTAAARTAPGVRTPATDAAWNELVAEAAAPYRSAGAFAWHFARGKLGRDPVFRGLLERGELRPHATVVDIGCGQALLASLLAASESLARKGRWPAAWPAPPRGCGYHGIELMARDVERARLALGLGAAPLEGAAGPGPGARRVACADMREAALPACQTVVILDVLHYVDHAAQEALLARVHAALHRGAGAGTAGVAPAPRLLLRVGDAAQSRGFRISQWVDRVVTAVRGHRLPPTFGRPLADWVALLERIGFAVETQPMSQGTPFANVLLLGTPRPAPASVSGSASVSASV